MRTKEQKIISLIISVIALVGAYFIHKANTQKVDSLQDLPTYQSAPYVVVNDNQPQFEQGDLITVSYEQYTQLDSLGRCGYAIACVGLDIMPTEERGSIGQVKPSGWHTVKYDFVDGKYLYNRCHLLGYQLTGENANERNLITGTRYLNVEGMLPFENMIADYVKETGNHVIYRVTPVFVGEELLARGVQMEAYSVEDQGEGICFNVYAFNVQPGVVIDYATGESWLDDSGSTETTAANSVQTTYILNNNSNKFHASSCSQGQAISGDNREDVNCDREALINRGYTPAKCCNP